MFDNVYVLAEGYCVFRGRGSEIVEYVENIGLKCPLSYNPADFSKYKSFFLHTFFFHYKKYIISLTVIEISCGEYGRRYIDKMIENIDNYCPLVLSDTGCNGTKANSHTTNSISNHNSLQNCNDADINVKHLKAKSSDWEQFCTLLKRNMIQIFRNRQYLLIKFYTHVFLGLLIGTLFFQMGDDASKTLFNFGFCFTIIIAFMYIPLMPILLECK